MFKALTNNPKNSKSRNILHNFHILKTLQKQLQIFENQTILSSKISPFKHQLNVTTCFLKNHIFENQHRFLKVQPIFENLRFSAILVTPHNNKNSRMLTTTPFYKKNPYFRKSTFTFLQKTDFRKSIAGNKTELTLTNLLYSIKIPLFFKTHQIFENQNHSRKDFLP